MFHADPSVFSNVIFKILSLITFLKKNPLRLQTYNISLET